MIVARTAGDRSNEAISFLRRDGDLVLRSGLRLGRRLRAAIEFSFEIIATHYGNKSSKFGDFST
jgi:hypothetical protein